MTARFLVEDCLAVPNRRLFVAHGRILDGIVRIGQRVRSPAGLDASIAAVEFILLSATAGRENPALAFEYQSEDQLGKWQALSLAGQTLELEDSVAPADSKERAS